MTTRAVSFDFWKTLLAGTGMLSLALVAAAVEFGVRSMLRADGVPRAARLFSESGVFLIAYLVLLPIITSSLPAEVTNVLWRRGRSAAIGAVGGAGMSS